MALTDQDKVDVRRHAGYGAYGSGSGSLILFRYYAEFVTLEYRMNNFTDAELAVIQGQYLPYLNQLEQDIYNVRDNLDTKQAAVWHWNTNEMSDRLDLYNYQRKLLCAFLELPPGPFFVSSSGSGVRMSV